MPWKNYQSSVDRALDRHRLTNQLVRQFKSTTFLAFANPGNEKKNGAKPRFNQF
jgi:hypothetical protein